MQNQSNNNRNNRNNIPYLVTGSVNMECMRTMPVESTLYKFIGWILFSIFMDTFVDICLTL